ncbi:hypothetical protein SpCBS45565_g03586 [Spizellomyces sp. 'palustris']|nr:hypothetical protein SpCBS45565_g03586 [Spizellomyces sp. 'palustris']
MAARPLIALQRCFSSTVRTAFSAAGSRPALSTPFAAASAGPVGGILRRGLQDFFDNEKGWTWSESALPTGRAWLAAELRKKSFEDLHQLWWVCIKEQNKIYSQKEEARRFSLFFPHKDRLFQVKLTMNRIKQVVWERRTQWVRAQAVVQRERRAEELRTEGLSEVMIEQKLEEMFPVPIENIGKKPFKLKSEEARKKEIDLTGRGRKKSGGSTWYVV